MNRKKLRNYLKSKPGAIVDYPFDEYTRVYKVGGKMFALIAEDESPERMNLKCDPADSMALRAEYKAILPGFHMNKGHWITLVLDNTLSNKLIIELVDHSYDLVIHGLPKSKQASIAH